MKRFTMIWTLLMFMLAALMVGSMPAQATGDHGGGDAPVCEEGGDKNPGSRTGGGGEDCKDPKPEPTDTSKPTDPPVTPEPTPEPSETPVTEKPEQVTPIKPEMICVFDGPKYYAQITVDGKGFDPVTKTLEIDNIVYELDGGSVVAVANEGYVLIGQDSWQFPVNVSCYSEAVPGVPTPTTPETPAPTTPAVPETATPVAPAPTPAPAPVAEITTSAIPAGAPEGQLAQTGANTTGILWAGILLTAGAVLLFGVRRYKNN